ncbi:hypothetical protein [Hoeflea sp.]|nr:hypothetical protein [Hoeflea sp.]
MNRNRRTVADMQAMKGKRQLCKLNVRTPDEASGAAEAGMGGVWR